MALLKVLSRLTCDTSVCRADREIVFDREMTFFSRPSETSLLDPLSVAAGQSCSYTTNTRPWNHGAAVSADADTSALKRLHCSLGEFS